MNLDDKTMEVFRQAAKKIMDETLCGAFGLSPSTISPETSVNRTLSASSLSEEIENLKPIMYYIKSDHAPTHNKEGEECFYIYAPADDDGNAVVIVNTNMLPSLEKTARETGCRMVPYSEYAKNNPVVIFPAQSNKRINADLGRRSN